ncbi:MAG: hypothetical protein VXX13_11060, partial [Pseudomonadota bacterium]|nr:hypothetical protein [Pseudomonadota bacterium]
MESLIPPENAAKTSAETINRHIGWCLATRRRALGLSQCELADASDLSHRQFRDYERGATPIAVDQLFGLAWVMEMPLSSFFEELPQPSPQPFVWPDLITVNDPQAAELTRAFLSINDHDLRDRVVKLIRALSAEFLLAGQSKRV